VTWFSREEDFVATTNRMAVLFTLIMACAISAAAMDDLDGSTGTKPGQEAGHVTVSASTTKKPIRGRRLHQLGRGVFLAHAQRGDWHHHHIAGTYLCGMPKRGLGEGTTAVCRTVSKLTASQPIA